MIKSILSMSAVMLTLATVTPAFAADDVAGHPRVNEVNNRIDKQQQRIDSGVAKGTITEKQAAKDEAKLTNTEQKLSADEAKNNGHITKKEQRKLNKKLDKSSAKIKEQKSK